mmetsp:Transcript_18440/g.56763  ORF Transcript_18440/g.56763 Transcript_18440/m.56763 type:complete len:205 (-) Transcript_18440:63-677(-)
MSSSASRMGASGATVAAWTAGVMASATVADRSLSAAQRRSTSQPDSGGAAPTGAPRRCRALRSSTSTSPISGRGARKNLTQSFSVMTPARPSRTVTTSKERASRRASAVASVSRGLTAHARSRFDMLTFLTAPATVSPRAAMTARATPRVTEVAASRSMAAISPRKGNCYRRRKFAKLVAPFAGRSSTMSRRAWQARLAGDDSE